MTTSIRSPCHLSGGAAAVVVALALTPATGTRLGPSRAVLAQAEPSTQKQNACGLLTTDEIGALVPDEHTTKGMATDVASVDFSACTFIWGVGTRRVTFVISVSQASSMFAGLTADAVKAGLASWVAAESIDESIADVGEAAVFKAYSPFYVGASAYAKGRILQLTFDGYDARTKKATLISLLKTAAPRL
jgi:hypothetical protein